MISKFSHMLSWVILIICVLNIFGSVLLNDNWTGWVVSSLGWLCVVAYERRIGIK
jgi:hypothetical protein